MRILDLGCGIDREIRTKKFKIEKAKIIGLDNFQYGDVDIIHDLEKMPLPFNDNYFDKIIASHILEHIQNFFPLMKELHRILKPNGILDIYVPNGLSWASFYLDHKRSFNLQSFRFLKKDCFENHTGISFEILKEEFNFAGIHSRWYSLNFIINPILNLWKGFVERFIPALPDEIHIELKKV
jgi:SAM-dependent methyltransferase